MCDATATAVTGTLNGKRAAKAELATPTQRDGSLDDLHVVTEHRVRVNGSHKLSLWE